jgi:glycosyltransferase involved in cell wall biosynthesis
MSVTNLDQTRPTVSVIVPMLNADAYIEDALRSILQERDVSIEVIVVDDGSIDNSRQLAASLGDARVRIVDGPRKGISASLNTGIEASCGSIVMRCDADDLYPEGRIRRQVAWLEENPEHDALCGAFSTIDRAGRVISQLVPRDTKTFKSIEGELRRGKSRTHLCTFAIRKRVFERIGMFREYFETGEDIDFQYRLGEVFRVAYEPMDNYFYRLHGASITHSRSSRRRVFFDDMALEFQRQRLSAGADALQLGKAPAPPVDTNSPAGSLSMQMHGMLVGQSWRDLAEGRVRASVGRAWRAVETHPLQLSSWMNFAKILFRAAFPKQ